MAQLLADNQNVCNQLNTLTTTIQNLTAAIENNVQIAPTSLTPSVQPSTCWIKPSLPSEFSGDWAKGRMFLNSCELYLWLALEQFTLEEEQVSWAYSFIKNGCAALFIDRVLWFETRSGTPCFTIWAEFRDSFRLEFCPKNKMQMVLAKLETPGYFQAWQSMDEYIDEFHDLIDTAGYQEGLAIIIKFRRGLQCDIQDQIVQLPYGWPVDDDPDTWYSTAIQCAANREANATFYGIGRNLPTPQRSTLTFSAIWPVLTLTPMQHSPTPALQQQPKVEPGPVPMDVDVNRTKSATPITCYPCGRVRHKILECPDQFDIRFITMDKKDK